MRDLTSSKIIWFKGANARLHWLRDIVTSGLALVYPEVCQVCGQARATPDESFVCTSCRASVRFVEQPFCNRCGCPFPGAITTIFECSNCRDHELYFSHARSAV